MDASGDRYAIDNTIYNFVGSSYQTNDDIIRIQSLQQQASQATPIPINFAPLIWQPIEHSPAHAISSVVDGVDTPTIRATFPTHQ
jgi:hypothetical protein